MNCDHDFIIHSTNISRGNCRARCTKCTKWFAMTWREEKKHDCDAYQPRYESDTKGGSYCYCPICDKLLGHSVEYNPLQGIWSSK